MIAGGLVRSNVMENYYSLSSAAERLGVSVEAVRRLFGRGTIRGIRFEGRIFVRRSDVDARAKDTPHNSRRRSA